MYCVWLGPITRDWSIICRYVLSIGTLFSVSLKLSVSLYVVMDRSQALERKLVSFLEVRDLWGSLIISSCVVKCFDKGSFFKGIIIFIALRWAVILKGFGLIFTFFIVFICFISDLFKCFVSRLSPLNYYNLFVTSAWLFPTIFMFSSH